MQHSQQGQVMGMSGAGGSSSSSSNACPPPPNPNPNMMQQHGYYGQQAQNGFKPMGFNSNMQQGQFGGNMNM